MSNSEETAFAAALLVREDKAGPDFKRDTPERVALDKKKSIWEVDVETSDLR